MQDTKWDAGLYDDRHSFVWKKAAGVLELLAARPGERILDLGCGTGHLTKQIAEAGAQVIGVDSSPEMIRRAKENYPQLHFEVMDARNLRFSKEFDGVFSNATLHWIKESEVVIEGIARALRSGGRFIAEFGGRGNTAKSLAATERAWSRLELPPPFENPWYYPSIAEYAGVLERSGLEVTYAILFDRSTGLEDGERGLRNWINMFFDRITKKLPMEQRERFIGEIEQQAHGELYREGQWVLDYRRLRLTATKRNETQP